MGYKDMMRMIGNFKHVPAVIANSAPKQEYNKYDNGGTLDETDPFWPYQQTNYFNPSLSTGWSPFHFGDNFATGLSGSLNYTYPLFSSRYSTPEGQDRFDFGPSLTMSGLMGQEEDAYTSTWQGEPYTSDESFWNKRTNIGLNAAYQSLIGNKGLVAGGELEGGIGFGTNTTHGPYGFEETPVGGSYASGQFGLGYYPEDSPYNARAVLGYGTELAPAHRPGGYFGLYGGLGPVELGITKDKQGWSGGFGLNIPLGSRKPEVIPEGIYDNGGIMPVEGGMGSISSSSFSEAADIKNRGGGQYKGLTPYNMDVSFEHDLITSNIGSFKKGGKILYDEGGIEDVTAAVAGTTEDPGAETLLLDESSNLMGDINPHVSDENWTSYYNQLKISENAANKGYDKEKDLWFPFDVSDAERNIGWGINMSTFSKEERERISKGITTVELEQMYSDRIANHLNKTQDYIDTWQGDWTRDDKSGNTGYKGKEGNWNKLPDNLKLALTDFSYNLGGLEKFPKFVTAVMNNDLEGAKAEYKRYWKNKGVKTELTKRNEEIYKMIFENAKGDGKIYRKGGSFAVYTKGGLFDTGGTVDETDPSNKTEVVLNYSQSYGSRRRGAFPRMVNEDSGENPNLNLSENAYLALCMAQYYGYTGEIEMTSGQRGGKDQTRVYSKYQRNDAHVYRRFPQYQQAIADSLGVSLHDYKTNNVSDEQWKNQDTEAISGWIDDIWAKVQSEEMTMDEANKLYPMHHMTGDAGDFTGDFRQWLQSSKSKEFRENFNISVLNERDHFHVTFGENVNVPEEHKMEYVNHKDQFNSLSIDSEDVVGTKVINMNPSTYQGEQRNLLYGPYFQPIKIESQDVTLTSGVEPPATLKKATLPPGYKEYQQYRSEMKDKEEKTLGYRIHSSLESMDTYTTPKHLKALSFDEWLNENPEFKEVPKEDIDKGESKENVSVVPGDHGVPFPGSVEDKIVEEPDHIETIMKKTGKTREEVISILESTREKTLEERNDLWRGRYYKPEKPFSPDDFPWKPEKLFSPDAWPTPFPLPNPEQRGYPDDFWPNPVPRKPTPGPWETLPAPLAPPAEVNPYQLLQRQQNLKTSYDINSHIGNIKNMINNWKSNK